VATAVPPQVASSHGAIRCSKVGKWNSSAYRPVSSVPSQSPTTTPSAQADGDDQQHQLQVVQAIAGFGIAERLQRRDLLALRRHQARDDDVEEERGDGQEDGRQHGPEDALLLDLAVEHRVRGLMLAAVRLRPP
jgi:hypothetical protein